MQIALKHKRTANTIFYISAIILLSIVCVVAVNTTFALTDKILDGVSVGNISLSGFTVQEAKTKINTEFNRKMANTTITIRYKEKIWTIIPNEIELHVDADSLVARAYEIGRTGNLFTKLQDRIRAITGGVIIPPKVSCNDKKLKAILVSIANSVDVIPQNAILEYTDSEINIKPELVGCKTDIAQSMDEFRSKINDSDLAINSELKVNQSIPSIVSKDLQQIDTVLAVYTTEFDPTNKNRSQNISLAVNNINNTLVRPGEVFSFNKHVGLRLAEYGYKEAPVFIDGKLVLDWGGGVCQVSSTLYNAALLSAMDIIERTSHFHPPEYVPLGQDAAVADNLLDFKFKNTSTNNIYIISEVLGNEITVYILGKKDPNSPEIRIIDTDKKVLEPNTLIKQDPNLAEGKEVVEAEGQKGFHVATYRIKIVNGKEIGREFISVDDFNPEDKIIRVGTQIAPFGAATPGVKVRKPLRKAAHQSN